MLGHPRLPLPFAACPNTQNAARRAALPSDVLRPVHLDLGT